MSDILHTFLRYAYVMHYVDVIPPDLHSEAFEELRRLSDQLYTDMDMIPKCLFNYPFFGKYCPFLKRKWFIRVRKIWSRRQTGWTSSMKIN